MADYIYLLENRLSPAQRLALRTVRETARARNLTVFLVGGAVRDLTSGSPVRDLDVVVQGNAFDLRRDLEKSGAILTGKIDAAQSLFFSFAGGVRMEIGSTLSTTFPKPGKPVYKPATIQDDLRRRDFTANAMALSLNEGSYGLLMDPLNGIADIENRELRLVSNYGFIEDPARMIRAARFMARLGWTLDEKTQQRYETGKQEGYVSALSEAQRGYETEEIVHEEDPLRVLRRLESEGWMQSLAPYWTSAKVDLPGLEHLREVQTQLQMQGIQPDASAANFPLLTARLAAKDVATLKAGFVRQGFVKDIESLEAKAKELTSLLGGKATASPSDAWKTLHSAAPEAVLWVAFSSKNAAIQAKFKSFFTTWPLLRQKIPYTLMQEMRIVPDLAGYDELVQTLFFELLDDKLQTPEEQKVFLEPYSPPAPPPPVSMRRPRAAKKDAKGAKSRSKKVVVVEASGDDENDDVSEELDEVLTEALTEALDDDGDEESIAPIDLALDEPENDEASEDDDEEEVPPVKALRTAPAKAAKVAKPVVVSPPAAVAPKTAPETTPKTAPKATPKPAAKLAAKAMPAVPAPKKPVVPPPARKVEPRKQVAAPVSSRVAARRPAAATPQKAAPGKKAAPVAATKAVKTAPPAKKVPAKNVAVKVVTAKKATSVKSAAKKAVPAKPASKKTVPGKKRR